MARRPSARSDRSIAAATTTERRRAQPGAWFRRLAARHAQVLFYALGRMAQRPLSSFLTIAVIGITLSLPAGLNVLLRNAAAVGYSWESAVQASLFLNASVTDAQGHALADELAARSTIKGAEYISREQALAEFKRLSGFGAAVTALDENPLPAVIVVRPRPDLGANGTEALVNQLDALPQVDQARMDQEWLRRLYAILDIVRRGALVLAALLGAAVIIIVGNTIRLDIHNQKEAIEIMKLLGASDRFIRRPFLYTGLWYGLFGGILAWLVVAAALIALSGPVAELSSLYQAEFNLASLSFRDVLLLLLGGTGLGFLGSWWAVGRHLRAIQPR